VACPFVLSPQQVSAPLEPMAQQWCFPQATVVWPVVAGEEVAPLLLLPQQSNPPVAVRTPQV